MNRKEKIVNHVIELWDIFPDSKRENPYSVYDKLKNLEKRAQIIKEKYANGDIDEPFGIEEVIKDFFNLMGNPKDGIILQPSLDPRGYFFKLSKKSGLSHVDWGGFGIIAPEIK